MGRRTVGPVLAVLIVAGLATWPGIARAQSRERTVTATGPRGRTIERDFSSARGPGTLNRQATITRPGGTIQRDFSAGRAPGPAPFVSGGGGYGPRPPSNLFIERNVIVNRGPSRAGAFGLGAGVGALVGTGAGLLLGSALSNPPPPPMYVTPAPVVVAPAPPTVVVNPPVRYQPSPGTVVIDPVAMAVDRLGSSHANSRRDGAITLGRLGDPRALPALVDRLKYDKVKDVRIAAATALGQIGDPAAAIYLERAITYDKKQDVRDAAASALARLPRVVPAPDASLSETAVPLEPTYPPVSRTNPPPSPDPVPTLEPLADPEPSYDTTQPGATRRFLPIEPGSGERVPPTPTPVPRSPGA
ncbi:MAG: HEAT repeat domain-containing protein [Isosphaeraceae bacterium]